MMQKNRFEILVEDIRRATRRWFAFNMKIPMVMDGLIAKS